MPHAKKSILGSPCRIVVSVETNKGEPRRFQKKKKCPGIPREKLSSPGMVFSRQTGLNSAAWLPKNSAVIFSTTIKYNMAARLQEYSATVLPYSSTIYPHTTCMQTTYKYQKYFSPEHKQHWHPQKNKASARWAVRPWKKLCHIRKSSSPPGKLT